ncbi:hypothetical protein [Pseudomonas fluorescens]|uniref:TauD/TfdA-like domain-containing protein n=1 Tax=Pseudomonas fluorescens TaxID=294 RepID=A0A5E7FXK4_PSEFL|nr:hypothetical protein [Pseudomonas fluorescens]VVO43484.1 hypothetical protein PS723_06186 [Pseudomonas fluorescens]
MKQNTQCEKPIEIEVLTFTDMQAKWLESSAIEMARAGGPQSAGSTSIAGCCAACIEANFTAQQAHACHLYARGGLSALVFQGLLAPTDDVPPTTLPSLHELEEDFHCMHLASRNQILLKLVQHTAFAYDIDNKGKIVRLVGNFKGGGKEKLSHEDCAQRIELSSHAGLRLGPHTEAPYHCSINAVNGHSPAPSALILTARWNPENQPTCVIPAGQVISKIGALSALALTSNSFNYSRSDSFITEKGEDGVDVSILCFDENGSFALRYNAYRFSLNERASDSVKVAFSRFREEIEHAEMLKISLQPTTALLINNCRALHCRDVIEDNRRLLVRLFGYSRFATPIVLNNDPLLVQG